MYKTQTSVHTMQYSLFYKYTVSLLHLKGKAYIGVYSFLPSPNLSSYVNYDLWHLIHKDEGSAVELWLETAPVVVVDILQKNIYKSWVLWLFFDRSIRYLTLHTRTTRRTPVFFGRASVCWVYLGVLKPPQDFHKVLLLHFPAILVVCSNMYVY